jgi:FkbM family methyltransferase
MALTPESKTVSNAKAVANLKTASNPKTLLVPETGIPVDVYPYPLPLKAPFAATLYVDDTPDDITQGLRAGTYSLPSTFSLVQALVPAGGRVLDLGAHIGTFTVTAATWGYEVLAVEASPHNATILQHNIEANALAQRAQVARTAVGDQVGSIEFVAAGPYGAVANRHLADPTITVPITTATRILAEKGWTQVDLIKLDVEGSEVAVLRAMTEQLKLPDAPPILFESNGHTLHFFDETPQTLLRQLESVGYHCYLIHGDQRLMPVSSDFCQPEVCVDYLAVKQPLPPVLQKNVSPALDFVDLIPQIVAASWADHPHPRAHVARAIATLPLAQLAHPELIDLLCRLAQDPDAEVRAAADWWSGGDVHGRSMEVMHHFINGQAAEIKRLRSGPAHFLRRFFNR